MFFLEKKPTADKKQKNTPSFARWISFAILTKIMELFLSLRLQTWAQYSILPWYQIRASSTAVSLTIFITSFLKGQESCIVAFIKSVQQYPLYLIKCSVCFVTSMYHIHRLKTNKHSRTKKPKLKLKIKIKQFTITMTVPNQAINDLGQDGIYFQDVKIQTAYQLNYWLSVKSPPQKGSPVTHTQTSKTEVKETKNRKMVLKPKKLNTA